MTDLSEAVGGAAEAEPEPDQIFVAFMSSGQVPGALGFVMREPSLRCGDVEYRRATVALLELLDAAKFHAKNPDMVHLLLQTAKAYAATQELNVMSDTVVTVKHAAEPDPDTWRPIAEITKGRWFLWCADLKLLPDPDLRLRARGAVGTVLGTAQDYLGAGVLTARGDGMSGPWTFTHFRPLFKPPGAE